MSDQYNSVIPLSPDLPYEDGAEDRILQILRSATDKSAGSDELASHITDWPTRYHLSRLRQDLFLPFHFSSQHRVLEIGCGTGANVRVIAETGAEVVGVEGTYVRAMSARTRCEGMENVTIYAGNANDLPDIGLFDAVLLIGVLEYSDASMGGLGGPDQLLQTARKHLKDDGQLILAIENQLGLKYLLSYPEDHLGLPWIGIEGYRNTNGIRTWSKAQLSKLLTKNGFIYQQWMYPFPDYKLPTFVATQELFANDAGRHLIKNVLRTPVVDYSGRSALVCDATSAFQTMVDAGLGPDVSNSFLIAARSSSEYVALTKSNEVGWLASGERRSKWRRYRTITATDNTLMFHSNNAQPEVVTEDWLSNVKEKDTEFIPGTPLDDLVIQSLTKNDISQTREYLAMYRSFLEEHAEYTKMAIRTPFFSSDEVPTLPENFLDCTPKNLLLLNQQLEFIDREWMAVSRLGIQQIWIRGLFEIASDMIRKGITGPFDPKQNLSELITHLSGVAGIQLEPNTVQHYIVNAEATLQQVVTGSLTQDFFENLANISLHDSIDNLPLKARLQYGDTVEMHNQHLREINNDLQVEKQHLDMKLDMLHRDNEALRQRIERQLSTLTTVRQQLSATRSSFSYKLGNLLIKPFAIVNRLFRRS